MDSAHEGMHATGRGLSPSCEVRGNGFEVVDGWDVTRDGHLRPHSEVARKMLRLMCEAEHGLDKDLDRCRVVLERVGVGDL